MYLKISLTIKLFMANKRWIITTVKHYRSTNPQFMNNVFTLIAFQLHLNVISLTDLCISNNNWPNETTNPAPATYVLFINYS